MSFGELFTFDTVFRREIDSINKRRAAVQPARPPIALEKESELRTGGEAMLRPTEESDVVGLALSGGGVRSAAFALGVLQALDETKVLDRCDYLSTVSGGGYIGSSLSAALQSNGGIFPFKSRLAQDETPALQHLRDHSNYLFPRSEFAFLNNASIYMRGLVANLVLVLPFLLLGAALTLFSNRTVDALSRPDVFGFAVPNIFPYRYFVITTYLGLALLIAGVIWGIARSFVQRADRAEVPSMSTTLIGGAVLLVFFAAFCELQPFMLGAMFEPKSTGPVAALADWVHYLAAALAPFAAVVASLSQKLGEFVKSSSESRRLRDQLASYAGTVAIYVAALFVPLLLWVAYLELSYWGLCAAVTKHDSQCAVPVWLGMIAGRMPMFIFYVLVAVALLLLSLVLRPNANSLHPLYRDRLRKAFLFVPQNYIDLKEGLQPARLRLSELTEQHAPYHLINTAINVQSSKAVNRRGRNADFFLFSRNFIGSKATGYVSTKDVEELVPELDLATAMAVSGAAASSEMGAATIKPLAPTLALLNVRLGYWLRNPNRVARRERQNRLANFYFLAEMFGRLNEKRKSVYLTDGGHIDNLGIYELLRRRCKVIIVVDAEADPQMGFGSLNSVERYARIDLGVRIDLPWQQISHMSRETGNAIDETGDSPKHKGPHCAMGAIEYPGNRSGVLVYIKSSLTGDENDYIFYYKKHHSRFPHETTLDQLFSEEQFEVYRALGFHAAYGLFAGRDAFAHRDPAACPQVQDELRLLDRLFLRRAGGGPGLSLAERLAQAGPEPEPAT
jgi:predicted acylesterase/phospholipase RssA